MSERKSLFHSLASIVLKSRPLVDSQVIPRPSLLLESSLLVVDVLLHLGGVGHHVVVEMGHDPDRADDDEKDERERREEDDHFPTPAGLLRHVEEKYKLDDELQDGEAEDERKKHGMRDDFVRRVYMDLHENISGERENDRADKTGYV